jgi:hypothetical protein
MWARHRTALGIGSHELDTELAKLVKSDLLHHQTAGEAACRLDDDRPVHQPIPSSSTPVGDEEIAESAEQAERLLSADDKTPGGGGARRKYARARLPEPRL